MSVVSLRVPSRLEYRELAIRALALVCKLATEKVPLGNERQRELTNEVLSAVGEAFNNAVLHGCNESSPYGEVGIAAEFDHERIVVEISDSGSSFAPEQVAPPDLASLPVSGMGLYIIRSFVDRFEYTPGRPNVLRLTKFLRRN